MQAVHAFEEDTYRHLDDGKDNGQLHLEVVCEGQELVTQEPNWVETEGVHMCGVRLTCPNLSHVSEFPWVVYDFDFIIIVRTSEELHWDGKELVVDETTEHREESHHKQDVSHAKQTLSREIVAELRMNHAEQGTEEKQKETMTDITEHDTE